MERKKATGWQPGNPNIADLTHIGNRAQAARVDAHRAELMPAITAIQKAGLSSYTDIARALIDTGRKTRRGGQWYPASVKRVMLED